MKTEGFIIISNGTPIRSRDIVKHDKIYIVLVNL